MTIIPLAKDIMRLMLRKEKSCKAYDRNKHMPTTLVAVAQLVFADAIFLV
jgi:hypothetical protein